MFEKDYPIGKFKEILSNFKSTEKKYTWETLNKALEKKVFANCSDNEEMIELYLKTFKHLKIDK